MTRPSLNGYGHELLLEAFRHRAGEDEGGYAALAFDLLAERLICDESTDVLDYALAIMRHQKGRPGYDALLWSLMEVAGSIKGPHGVVRTLVTVPLVLEGMGALPPDPVEAAETLVGCGWWKDGVRFHPAWIPLRVLGTMHPCRIRRVLHEMVAGGASIPVLPASVRQEVQVLLGVETGDESTPDDWDSVPAMISAFSDWSAEQFPDSSAVVLHPRTLDDLMLCAKAEVFGQEVSTALVRRTDGDYIDGAGDNVVRLPSAPSTKRPSFLKDRTPVDTE